MMLNCKLSDVELRMLAFLFLCSPRCTLSYMLPYFPGRMVTGSVRNTSDIREAACGGNSFSSWEKQHNLLRNVKSLINKGTQGDAKFELGHLAETMFSFVFMQPFLVCS